MHDEGECLALPQLCAAQSAGHAVMGTGSGAARSLFVAGTILVVAHVTLLVFDPQRCSCLT
jgi:hypothetical protein